MKESTYLKLLEDYRIANRELTTLVENMRNAQEAYEDALSSFREKQSFLLKEIQRIDGLLENKKNLENK